MRCVLLVVLFLSACSPGPSNTTNPYTGVTVARSGYDTIDRHYPSRFEAEAAVLRTGADALYVINIAVTRSDKNYPKISSIWVPGREINYIKIDTRRVGSDRQEVGYIQLNRALFELAARRGFDLQVISPRTSHDGHIPAAAFRRALREAARSGADDAP